MCFAAIVPCSCPLRERIVNDVDRGAVRVHAVEVSAANRFAVPLQVLDAVHVPLEDQVTEIDADPPVPDITDEQERERLQLLRVGGGGF